jgi:hypothetical protein
MFQPAPGQLGRHPKADVRSFQGGEKKERFCLAHRTDTACQNDLCLHLQPNG